MAKACIIRNKRTNAIEKVSAANGKESKLFKELNSLIGNEDIALLAWARTYSKEFKDWFGDSKAVDENGEPVLLYLDKSNTNNTEFKFTIKPNNQPVYLNTQDVDNNTYSVNDPNQIKKLLNVVPEVSKINYEVNNSDEYFKKVKIATRDGHSNIVDYKNKQKNIIRNKISSLKDARKTVEATKPITQEDKDKQKKYLETIINIENRLKNTLNSINDDLNSLRKDNSLQALKSIADRDFTRLENLINKPGVRTASEIEEIKQIVDFYYHMEMKKDKPHSIYGRDFGISELYNKISKEEKDLYNEFHLKANEYRNKIGKLEADRVAKIVNNNTKVKSIFDEDLSYNEITESRTDTNVFDMFLMDATMGIFSSNGLLPQVSLALLEDYQNKELSKSNKQISDIEELAEKAKYLLDDISSGGFSFIGKKAKDWSVFKQVDEFGLQTGDLIVRYSTKFFNDRALMNEKFNDLIAKARNMNDFAKQNQLIEQALEKRKEWYNKNTIQINPGMIPEIIEEFSSNPLFKTETDKAKIDAHVKELKDNLGENGYREEINKQKNKVRSFLNAAKAMKEFSTEEGYNTYVIENSPFSGIEYANSVGNPFGNILPNMEYNITVPRKKLGKLSVKNKKYVVEDTNSNTNYYDEKFNKIDQEDELYVFYRNMMDILKEIKEGFPVELQDKLNVNSIPAFKKALNEIVIESQGPLDKFSKSSSLMMTRLAENFTTGVEDRITYARINHITGKTNYEINASFLNQNKSRINDAKEAEYALFKNAYEVRGKKLFKGVISVDSCSDEALSVIADNLDMAYVDKNEIKTRIGENFSPKVFFESVAKHRLAQDKSFDLPRVLKMYSEMSAKYRARSKSKPLIDLLKAHYESIKRKATTDTGKEIEGDVDELRKNAIKQYRDWYKRVVLNNFSEFKGTDLSEDFMPDDKSTTNRILKKITSLINFDIKLFKKVLSEEEKRLKSTLEKLISSEKDPKKAEEYKQKIEKLGKSWTTFSIVDGILNAIRVKNLGWNISSAITNYMEGEASNLVLAAQGDYFSQDTYWKAKGIVTRSFGKFLFKNSLFDANKLKTLMNKVDILQDSANELQKSSDISNFGSKLDKLNPMELNRRTEYVIQSPVFISMLLEQTITDSNGENPSSVWDAMDENGNLRPPYNTEKNIATWQNMNTKEFNDFKSRVSSAITQAHGNYNELRGMLAKSNIFGKMLIMFKTWLPNALYTRFAVPQTNLLGGIKDFKGRYHSFTGPTAALFGGVVGIGTGGAMWGLSGAALGMSWNFISNKMLSNKSDYVVPRTEMSYIKELLFSTTMFLHKSMSMPVNRLANLLGISSDKLPKLLNSELLDYRDKISDTFTERDAKNLNANMSELSMAIQKIYLMILVKALLWDDDEDDEDTNRRMYNLYMNRLDTLFENINQYNVNMFKLGEQAKPVIWKTLKDFGNVVTAMEESVNGNDVYTTGIYVGQSKLKVAFSKAFLPGIFKDPLSLGLFSQMEREFDSGGFSKTLKYYFMENNDKERNRLKQIKAKTKQEIYEIELKKFEKRGIILNAKQRKKLKSKIDSYLRKKYPLPPT